MSNITENPTSGQPQVVVIEKRSNGWATAALVVGIIAIAGSWVPFLNVAAMFLAVVALALLVPALIVGRKSKQRIRAIVGGLLAVITIVVAMVANLATVAAVDDAFDATDDISVTIGEATVDELGWTEVPVTVENVSGTEQSILVIDLVAESADGSQVLDTTTVSVESIEPGQTATETATFTEELPKDAVISVESAF